MVPLDNDVVNSFFVQFTINKQNNKLIQISIIFETEKINKLLDFSMIQKTRVEIYYLHFFQSKVILFAPVSIKSLKLKNIKARTFSFIHTSSQELSRYNQKKNR